MDVEDPPGGGEGLEDAALGATGDSSSSFSEQSLSDREDTIAAEERAAAAGGDGGAAQELRELDDDANLCVLRMGPR